MVGVVILSVSSKMSRFRASKYKNAFSHVYKKEMWINDLSVGSNLRSSSHHISASSRYIAFIHDSNSVGCLAVLPLQSHGRFLHFPMIAAHSAFITDFTFSPFDDRLLASGAEDGVIKVWQLPEELSGDETLSTPIQVLPQQPVKVESMLFHPTANNVLASAGGPSAKVWDIERGALLFDCTAVGTDECIQSIGWHGNGSMLASLSKAGRERVVRVFDVRAGSSAIAEAKCHSALKDAVLVWLGDSPRLVSAGFNMTRDAELAVWDISNGLSGPVSRLSLGSSSTGSPMLFYDDDTNMIFLAMKSESSITFFESVDKSPYLSQGSDVCRCPSQTKGLALLPKTAVDVMACQVASFMQLTQNAIVPIGYHVQRKSHSEFHADLFPDTVGSYSCLSAEDWAGGKNEPVARVSLDPAKRKAHKVEGKKESKAPSTEPAHTSKEKPARAVKVDMAKKQDHSQVPDHNLPPKNTPHKAISFVRSSKFRHIEGQLSHRSSAIDKVPTISSTVPGDSNAFAVNKERVGVVLSVPGGQVAVLELSKAGRLDTDSVPTLQNSADVMDFSFDPFNSHRLAVACDDAKIRVWTIPESGLTKTLTEPDFFLIGHHEKPNILTFHPQARDLLMSAGYDGKIFIWDLSNHRVAMEMDPLSQPLFAASWSPNGACLATLAKDHRLRVYNPRSSPRPLGEGEGPLGSRGARVTWLDNNTLLVSGFNKTSVRSLGVYSVNKTSITMKSEVTANISPATLVPYFDPDTRLVFLSGKGDTNVLAYEYVPTESPYLFEVTPFACGSPHQAIGVLPKVLCDVERVEVLRGVRLTKSSVEQFTIRVPRTRLEYFQDDIYPATLVVWESALSAQEWLAGKDGVQPRVSLQPQGMKPLSEAPKASVAAKKFPSYNPDVKSDQQKKEELLSAMIGRMGEKEEDPLPQTAMDGCDSDEWSD